MNKTTKKKFREKFFGYLYHNSKDKEELKRYVNLIISDIELFMSERTYHQTQSSLQIQKLRDTLKRENKK